MKKFIGAIVISVMLVSLVGCRSNNTSNISQNNQNNEQTKTAVNSQEINKREGTANTGDKTNNIKMTIGDKVVTAALDNSQTTQDFLKSLPRTMKMTRYGDREYYGKVGKAFSEDGEKIEDFKNGDVTYYAPGGSLAIFFDNEENSIQSGLIRMGRITSDLGVFINLGENEEMLIEVSN